MITGSLEGQFILLVEDEPLIVLDITNTLEPTGAAITSTNTIKHALLLVEHDGLTGAILDHALPDGDSTALCSRLTERGVPFMIYSGYDHLTGPCANAPYLAKPATADMLVSAVCDMIYGIDVSPASGCSQPPPPSRPSYSIAI